VLAARDGSHAELADLCGAYWPPLYSYLRRRGYSAEDAQDLTQSYFSRLLEKGFLDHADAQRGRFRSFLLTSLKNFVANEWHREHAQKRGGHTRFVSLDDVARAESSYGSSQAATNLTPEMQYQRNWALTVLERVTGALAAEFAAVGKLAVFDALKGFLTGDAGEVLARLRHPLCAKRRRASRCTGCAGGSAICCGRRSGGRSPMTAMGGQWMRNCGS
jgi:RNA polymerase sigma-70 factor (ECF subfamily)